MALHGPPARASATLTRVRRPASQPSGVLESPRSVELPGGPIAYLLRESPRARRVRLVVDPRRGVVVTVPARRRGWRAGHEEVEAFLYEREAWLRRHLDRQARQRSAIAARGPLGDGATIRFRGELHRLRVEAAHAGVRRSTVSRDGGEVGDELVIRIAARDRRELVDVLADWLKARARAAIEREIERHAGDLGVVPAAVTIRDQRTRWGSASRSGRLSFSWRLVLAPAEALETVVVHELAHLRAFGHGSGFWALVASRRPDHAVWRRWLREHSLELHEALSVGS